MSLGNLSFPFFFTERKLFPCHSLMVTFLVRPFSLPLSVLVISPIQFIQPLPWLLDDVICCSPRLPALYNKTYFVCDDNATSNRCFSLIFLFLINSVANFLSDWTILNLLFTFSSNLSLDRTPSIRIRNHRAYNNNRNQLENSIVRLFFRRCSIFFLIRRSRWNSVSQYGIPN